MIFVKSQEKGARVVVNVKIKHEFNITFGNGFTQVLSRDEAHQLWVQLNKEFGAYISEPSRDSILDQIKRNGDSPKPWQNPRGIKFY